MKIPSSLAPFLQEYDLEKFDPELYKSIIIERTLEFGTSSELRWLFRIYPKTEIIEFVKRHGYRKLSPKAFSFWKYILRIKECEKPEWLKDKYLLWRF